MTGTLHAAPVVLDALPRRVLRGIRWSFSAQLVRGATRFATLVVLARLLAPADFGVFAMALVFAGIGLLLFDFGLGAALVQRRELSDLHCSTVFWTNVALGVACALAGLILASPIAALYGEPRVAQLVAVLAAGFVLTALGSTQTALLTRALDLRAVETAVTGGTVLGAAAAVLAALQGLGAWALVVQHVGSTAVTTVLLWSFSAWRPRFAFSRRALRELGGFALNLSASRLLFYAYRNADNLLVGRFLGGPALGLYALAYNLVLTPFSRVVDPVRAALFPALSRVQDDRPRAAAVWLRGTRLLAAFVVPALLGLCVVAPALVEPVLGERWAGATPLVRIFALAGALQAVASLNSVVLSALGRTGTLLRFSVVTFALSLAGFAAGLPWGVKGVALGYLAANLVVLPLYTWLTARAVELSARDLWRSVSGVFQAALGMVAVVLVLQAATSSVAVPAGAGLAATVVVGVAAFLLLCRWRASELVADVRELRAAAARAPSPSTL